MPTSLREQTAVVMPIYNEAPSRVFAAMQAMIEDVEKTGLGNHYSWFFLSDTTNPDVWVAEEDAYLALRRRVGDHVRVYYRHRPKNIARKAGNIEEFLKRWGGAYEHMIVLDADSLMTGECIVTLTAAMEADPDAGIIQTLPLIINRNTFFARLQQFSARLYGTGDRRGSGRVGGPPGQLLGPQRDHPLPRVRLLLLDAHAQRQAALRRPRSQPRFRRGRDDACAAATRSTCCRACAAATRKARPR